MQYFDFTRGMFVTFAGKPQYKSRLAVIIYGEEQRGETRTKLGRLWLRYIGELSPHRGIDFTTDSIGYKIISGKYPSPRFVTKDEAKRDGQDRGREAYRPFYIFLINQNTVLAIDWPDDLAKDDKYVDMVAQIMNRDIIPAIAELLAHWSGNLTAEVRLEPL